MSKTVGIPIGKRVKLSQMQAIALRALMKERAKIDALADSIGKEIAIAHGVTAPSDIAVDDPVAGIVRIILKRDMDRVKPLARSRRKHKAS